MRDGALLSFRTCDDHFTLVLCGRLSKRQDGNYCASRLHLIQGVSEDGRCSLKMKSVVRRWKACLNMIGVPKDEGDMLIPFSLSQVTVL